MVTQDNPTTADFPNELDEAQSCDRASLAAKKRLSTLVDQRFSSGGKKKIECASFAQESGFKKHFS
jgi:hypothetical protein